MRRPLKPNWVIIHADEDTVSIANTRTGAMLMSNFTGASILQLCDGQRDTEEIVDQLHLQASELDKAIIARDVESFLQTAGRYELVVEGEDGQ